MKKQLLGLSIIATVLSLSACAGGFYDSGYSYSSVTHYETVPESEVIVQTDRYYHYPHHRHGYRPVPVVVHDGGSRPHYGPPSGGSSRPHYAPSSGNQPHYGPPSASSSRAHYGPPSGGKSRPHYGSEHKSADDVVVH